MKKLLVALLALGIVAVAFAQDAPTVKSSFSAYLDGGVLYDATNSNSNIYFYGDESGAQGGRFQMNGSFSYGDFGMKFRFRAQPFVNGTFANNAKNGTGASYADLFVRRAWAYYNLFNNMVQLNAGIFGIGDYSTSYIGSVALDNPNTGIYVKAMPVAGLTVGYFLPANADTAKLSDALNGSIIGVNYSMDKVATVQGWVTSVGAKPEVVADVNVSAVENLTLTAEVYYATGTDYSGGSGNADGLYAGEQIGYQIGAMQPGVWITENMPNSGTSTFTVNPWFNYNVSDTATVGTDVYYSTESGVGIAFDGWGKVTLGKNYIKAVAKYDTTATTGGLTFKFLTVASF